MQGISWDIASRMKGIALMARTPVHEMTREEPVAEVEILRPALNRADVRLTTANILRALRDHVPAWLEEIVAADLKNTSANRTSHDG